MMQQPSPSIASIVRDPARMAALEQYLAQQGINGDSMLAHVNPREALALKMAGGAGTPNPKTGLPQFAPDPATSGMMGGPPPGMQPGQLPRGFNPGAGGGGSGPGGAPLPAGVVGGAFGPPPGMQPNQPPPGITPISNTMPGMPGGPQPTGTGGAAPTVRPAAAPTLLPSMSQILAAQGKNGDTMLAHINPQEAALLESLGGAGTQNPNTGLPQFFVGGADGGLAAGGDTGVGAQSGGGYGSGPGGTGLGNAGGDSGGGWGGVPGDNGLRGPLGQGGLPVHTSAEGYAGMPTGTPGGASTTGGVGSAYESANASYKNRGFFDRALDFVDPFGFHNMKPVPGKAPTYAGGAFHTGWNPGAALGSLAGLAAPGLGTLGSLALGKAYTALGGPDIAMSGGDVAPGFGNASTPAGAAMAAAPGENPTPGAGLAMAGAAAAQNGGGGYGVGPDRDPRATMPGGGVPSMGNAGAYQADNQNNNPNWLRLARLGLLMNPGKG